MAINTNIKSKLYNFEKELIPGLPNDMALECLLRVPIDSHSILRHVSTHWKTTLSHSSFFDLRRRVYAAEHLLFLIQPLSAVARIPPQQETNKDVLDSVNSVTSPLIYNISVYNSTLNEWKNMVNVTIPTFAQCVAIPASAKVVILGGWGPATLLPVTDVLVIDLSSGTWKQGSPMPTARSFFAAASVGPTAVYVAGGHDGRKNALRTAEVYDVDTDTWRKLPDMEQDRDEAHGLVLNDEESKFWVISGYGTESQGRFRSDAEVYDTKTGSWTRINGVWPYPGQSPKSTATPEFNGSRKWWCMIGGEPKEFSFEEMSWKAINLGLIPKSVIGSTSISMVEMGDDRVMVMGNGERNNGEECKEVGCCAGEGVFMLEKRTSEGGINGVVNWNWEHVHAPSKFSGFPFSSSHLLI
ncbi:F-box/kelch-repeat protein SKIP20-like [Silene latifolia]|uniref:F-box/kelch-repeat protein SKIP20-like n=1 Tax=Silene latifolia TaxID=37657 RepID=UPI003D77377C